ncbi:MAG: ABC transporter permease [Cyclobacteriaceae bacterium]
MLRNLFKVAIRNFIREKFYTILNVSGLAVGIAVAMLITIYIVNELSFDRFHSKSDRIYRLVSHLELGANRFDGNSTFPPMAKALESGIPEIEEAMRMTSGNRLFKKDDVAFNEENIFFADSNFFRVFEFQLLAGNPNTALAGNDKIVLIPAIAEKYFKTRQWSEVIGNSIQLGDDVLQVTGIMEEAPANSHFHPKAVASITVIPSGRDETWNSMNLSTYLVLREGASIKTVVSKIPDVIEVHNPGFKDLPKQGINLSFDELALTDIHLHGNGQGEFEPNGETTTLYIFGIVALVVLTLACVNFVNLTTARSSNRAKEVGVRKVLGSASHQLIRQFTIESIILVAIATLISLGLVELARVPFVELTGRELSFDQIIQPIGIATLMLFVILLGVLAGSYPSFFLSRLKPSVVLKGNIRSGFKSSKLRNSLVTLQFTISMILISCTLVVQQQLKYMRSKKLGFDKENMLVVQNADRVDSQQSLINELKQLPGISAVASSEFRPIDDYDGTVAVTEDDQETRKLVRTCHSDYDFLPTVGIEVVSGRNFSRDFVSDSAAVILNEVAAGYLFEGDPIGKLVYLSDNDRSRKLEVIGVVKDFNTRSLKEAVSPLVFMLENDQQLLHLRLNAGNYDQTIAEVESLWKKHSDISFNYSFLDESYSNLFKEESRLGTLFSVFTGLALIIACLGLLGLAAYMSEQRNKELSIRKVLGATATQIVMLLSRDFAKLILLSAILGLPLAYYAMNSWLGGYAYRTDLNAYVFVGSGVLVLAVALLAVSYQSIKAALVNPVESLKSE